MNIKLEFIESILGTWPGDPSIAETYIASKSPDAGTIADEIAAIGVDGVAEKQKTVFPKTESGVPILYDYQIKGFFKDSCGALRSIATNKSAKVKAYKKMIDNLIFIDQRAVPIIFEGEIGNCQRSLRASTPQGDRVCLANSEEIPAGATCEFSITCLDPSHEEIVREWLRYGRLKGIGQWRNASHGRFVYEEFDDNGELIGGTKAGFEQAKQLRATTKMVLEDKAKE